MSIGTDITYVLLFISLYFEVFLLVSFLEQLLAREGKTGIAAHGESAHVPSVAIVVPCFNEERSIASTLHSLLALDYPREKLEIIVVDDGSSDRTLEVAREFETDSRVRVFHKENGGKHTALNLASMHTDAELIGCLDADSTVEQDALLRATGAFADSSLAAVTPGIHVRERHTLLQHLQHVEYQLSIFNRCAFAGLGSVFITPGPFTIFRRAAICAVGGWRHGHSTEDMEIALRLQEAGFRIANNPHVAVHTSAPATLPALFRQRVRWSYGFLRNAFDYRHMIGNLRYGNLGIFVLPTALLSIASAIYFAGRLMWLLAQELQHLYTRVSIAGVPHGSFDPFFISTSVLIFSVVAAMILTTALITLGSFLSTRRRYPPASTPLFLLLYSFLVPLWLGAAVIRAILRKNVAWR